MVSLLSLGKKLKDLFDQGVNYFNPESNNGQNFWSTPQAKGLGQVQQTIQPLVKHVSQDIQQLPQNVGNTAKQIVINPVKSFQQITQLNNKQAPLFGGLRQISEDINGGKLPEYANPNLSVQQRMTDLINRTSFGLDTGFKPGLKLKVGAKIPAGNEVKMQSSLKESIRSGKIKQPSNTLSQMQSSRASIPQTATNQLARSIRSNTNQTIEQQASAMTAQEIRNVFSQSQIDLINKLKKITNSRAFKEGDIETLRKAGKGDIVEQALQAVKEMHPEIVSEADALAFALNLPTKADTIVKRTVLTPEEKALRIQALAEQNAFEKDFGRPATPQEQNKAITEWENQIKKETISKSQFNTNQSKAFNQQQAQNKQGFNRSFTEQQQAMGGTKAYKGGKIEEINKGFPAGALKSTTVSDKAPFLYQRETFLRNIEDTFKNKAEANAVKKYIHEPIVQNETKNVNWQNSLRKELTQTFDKLGVKRGSKQDYAAADYAEKTLSLPDLKRQFPNEWENIVAVSEKGKLVYQATLDKINRELGKYGYDPIPQRQNYVTHTRQIQTLVDKFGSMLNFTKEKLPTEMSAINVGTKPGRQFFKFGLKRQGGSTHEGLITALDRYITPAGNQIFHIEDVQRARAIQQYLQKSAKPQDSTFSNFNSYIGQYADYISGKQSIIDRPFEKVFGRGLLTLGNELKKRTGANMVGGNMSSALTNFIPFTESLATTSKPQAIRGMYEAALGPATGIAKIDGLESSFLTRRFPIQQIGSTIGSKAKTGMNFLFKTVDAFSARSIVAGKYFEGVSKGLTKDQAMAGADQYAARVLADRSFGQNPLIFNSKVLGAFTQFQVEVNNQVSFLMKDIPKNMGYNKIQVASSLTQFVIFSYLFNNMFQLITGRRPQIDPLHAGINLYTSIGQGKNPKDYLNPANQNSPVGEIVQNLPFTSMLSGGRIPIGSTLPDVPGLFNGQTTLSKEVGKSLSFLASPLGGGGQVQKTIQGIGAYNQGASTTANGNVRFPIEQNLQNRLRTTLFGQYSTPEANAYFQNNQKPLSDNQSEFFKQSVDKAGAYKDILLNRLFNDQSKTEPISSAGNAEESILRTKVKRTGQIQESNDTYFFKDNGSVKSVEKNRQVNPPELTKMKDVDEELISTYSSDLGKKKTDIKTLLKIGKISAPEADQQIKQIEKAQALAKLGVIKPINTATPASGAFSSPDSIGANVNSLIEKYFPQSEWATAKAVALAESGGNPNAVGDNYPINGETIPSYGLFQIRALQGRPDASTLQNPEENVKYAANLWKEQGWQPWSAYTNGSYQQYLGSNTSELNKELIAGEASKITTEINKVQKLYELGELTADDANAQITRLKARQKTLRASIKSLPKAAKITVKSTKISSPKATIKQTAASQAPALKLKKGPVFKLKKTAAVKQIPTFKAQSFRNTLTA